MADGRKTYNSLMATFIDNRAEPAGRLVNRADKKDPVNMACCAIRGKPPTRTDGMHVLLSILSSSSEPWNPLGGTLSILDSQEQSR